MPLLCPRLLAPLLLLAAPLAAQTAPTPPPTAPAPAPAGGTVVLNPFTVDAGTDTGYAATSTLGGTRLKSELRDVASQIDVMTSEFLEDIGALTLEESLRYSLNIETSDENFSPGTDPNTNSVFSSAYGSRTRGLSRSNNTHDFFETNVPLDTYNTGRRFTLVSGSNAILFGAGFAGGTNDVAFDRPDLRRFSGGAVARVDSNRGRRFSLNLNQPLVRGLVGIRVAGLDADERDHRDGVGARTRRHYASILVQPFSRLSVRGWYEKYDSRQRNAANTLTGDRVTPWLSLPARPFLNNAGLTAASTAAQFNTALAAGGPDLATAAERLNNVAVTLAYGADGTPGAIRNWTNTATSRRPLDGTQDPSITSPALYPLEASVLGNALQRWWRGDIRGALFEFSPLRDLHIEGGLNREVFDTRSLSFISGNNADLRVDLNRFLPDGATPNPNLGRTFVEDDITGSAWRNHRDERRLQVAYGLDLRRRTGWTRHLGSHQFAVMYTGAENMRVQQNTNSPRIVSENVFEGLSYPAGTTAANDTTRNSRRLRARFYLDSPASPSGGNSSVRAPFQLWGPETVVVGRDAQGRDVVVNTGMSSPYGAQVATSNGKKTEDAGQYAWQASLLDGRLNVTLGERFSRAGFSPWVGQGGTATRPPRRYNADTRAFEEPVNRGGVLTFASTGKAVGNAGFEPWDVMLARGGEHDSLEAASRYEVTSRLRGFVVHPFGRHGFLSLHYTASSSAFVADFTRKNPYGQEAQLDDGTTREYGLSLRFLDDRLVLRLNAYESVYLGVSGGSGVTVPAPPAVGGASGMDRTSIHWSAIHLEKSAQNHALLRSGGRYETATLGAPVLGGSANGIAADSPFRYLQQDVLAWPSDPAASGAFGLKYTLNSDRTAKGTEARLVANPVPGWSASLSLARNNSRNQRIASDWFNFIGYRMKDWLAAATDAAVPQRGGGNGPTQLHTTATTNANETMLAYLRSSALGWFFLRESEGQAASQEVEWRGNFTTAYRWSSGPLKGLRAGGSLRYRGDRILGYASRSVAASDLRDPLLATPGLFPAGSTVAVADVNRPLLGGATWNTDAVLGYTTTLPGRRVRWGISLNVRNLLNDDRLIPQAGLSAAGVPVVFQFPEPRIFLLTQTFDF